MARPLRRDNPASLVAPTRNRVFEEILDFFKQQLSQGTIKAGDRLLSERDLAEQLGVSRPSLREALRAMQMLGLVEIRHGQGAFVRAPDPSSLASFIGLSLAMQQEKGEGILEVRIAMECEAVRLACGRATSEDLQAMRAALERMPRTRESGDLGAQADFEFHNAVVRASHNPNLLFIYEAIEELLMKSHQERRIAIFGLDGALQILADAHRAVYESVAARDEERAVQELRKHFFYVREYQEELGGVHD